MADVAERETHDPLPEEAPSPQPERHEPRRRDPGLTDLSKRDYIAVLKRTVKEALADEITDAAAAIAYYSFLSIPSLLLLAVGVFGLVAGPDAVQTIMDRLSGVVPAEAITLFEDSLTRLTENEGGSVILLAIGFVVALWTATGAVQALMRRFNHIYERKETRGFVQQRITALGVLAWAAVAFILVFGLLILGPHLSGWVGDAVGLETAVEWIWWAAQWPILILGLLAAFAGIYYLGPNVDHPRWRFLTFGSVLAVVVWLAASGLFAVYVGLFGSYNKAWGSLAAVVVMLTWLWLSALAILLGAELNAEVERSRELRRGEPAEVELQAPTKE